MIVEGAIRYFAEVGFAGQTRELAQRLGVTQPLIYRYFPTKQDLIGRVYDEVFAGRWKPEWRAMLIDRSQPLRERLIAFYKAYAREALTYEWVRIYTFSGLAGGDLNRRYIDMLETEFLRPVCLELRHAGGLPDTKPESVSSREMESAWHAHAAIFYYFVRKFIYETPVEPDLDAFITDTVDRLLDGAPAFSRTLER